MGSLRIKLYLQTAQTVSSYLTNSRFMPNLYLLAGCNGAGKTTAAYTLLPEILGVFEFVNADEIARGLSPFNPDSVAFEAGRLMLKRIDHLMHQQVDFAFETTLSTRSYAQTIKKAQQQGYRVTLFYVWLESAALAKQRVASRVSKGGHNIPEAIIERRYQRSITNLLSLYLPICNQTIIVDNSSLELAPIAECLAGSEIQIIDQLLWNQLRTL